MAADDHKDPKHQAYICSYCGKGFPIRHRLNMHLLDHTGERRFLCNVCGRGFKRNSGLQGHLKTHGGDRPYSCSVCNKAFLSKYSCSLHLRIHTRVKPEICTYCGMSFRFPMDLNLHGKSAHPEVPAGNYTCDECNKDFTSLSAFSRHMVFTHNTQSHSKELPPGESEVSVPAEILEKVPESDAKPFERPYSGTFYGAEDTFECPVGWDDMDEEAGPTGMEDEEDNAEYEEEDKSTAQQSMSYNQETNPSSASFKTMHEEPTDPLQKPRSEENTETNSEDKSAPCPFCNTTFSGLVKLKVHMLTHMKNWQHMCQECGKECSSSADLKAHVDEHKGNNPSLCPTCGINLHNQADLGLQKCTCSQQSDDVTVKSECPSREDDQSDNDVGQMSDAESSSNPQPRTGYDSDTEEDMQEDKEQTPTAQKKSLSKKSPTKRKNLQKPNFPCDECSKVYTSETGYREHHLRVHQKVYRYICVICGQKFLSKPAWRSHELAHMNIKQFGCDTCGSRYKYKKDLILHQEKHLGLVIKCTNCDSSFATSTSLAKHQERCIQNKSYKCPECPHVASYKTNLKRHIKTMHKDSHEKDFKIKELKAEQVKALEEEAFKTVKAEELGQAPMLKQKRFTRKFKMECECGRVFTSEGGLRDHRLRVHQKAWRYSCTKCDKKFMSKTHWEGHELLHQQVKRFACEECDAKYTYKKDLTLHMAKHRGERYKCTQCSHTFSSPANLRKHQKVCIDGKLFYCLKCSYIANYKVNLDRHIKNNH